MRHFLPALILVLTALALAIFAGAPLSVMPHEPGVAAVVMACQNIDSDACDHAGCYDGVCAHGCCPAVGATLAPPGTPLSRLTVSTLLGLPADSWRDGISVRPVLGPPKLFV